jgi:hypothetical protein
MAIQPVYDEAHESQSLGNQSAPELTGSGFYNRTLWEYLEQGDPSCYISNLAKMKANYPGGNITKNLRTTFEKVHRSWVQRSGK